MIRSAALTRSLFGRSLAWEGRYLVVGFTAGEIPKLPLSSGAVLLRRLRYSPAYSGVAGANASHRRYATRYPTSRNGALPANSADTCTPSYPLKEIAVALKAIADRKVMGKIILQV